MNTISSDNIAHHLNTITSPQIFGSNDLLCSIYPQLEKGKRRQFNTKKTGKNNNIDAVDASTSGLDSASNNHGANLSNIVTFKKDKKKHINVKQTGGRNSIEAVDVSTLGSDSVFCNNVINFFNIVTSSKDFEVKVSFTFYISFSLEYNA